MSPAVGVRWAENKDTNTPRRCKALIRGRPGRQTHPGENPIGSPGTGEIRYLPPAGATVISDVCSSSQCSMRFTLPVASAMLMSAAP